MQKKEKIILVWYKRDLRVSDHGPLYDALQMGKKMDIKVLALYSFEPRVTSAPDFSSFHRQFIRDALEELSDSLTKIGVPLLIFERNISDVIKYILTSYHILHMFSHEETGNAITYERDRMMGKFLLLKGIPWTEYPTNGVVRRLHSRDDWSTIWNARMESPIIPVHEGQEIFTPVLSGDEWKQTIQNTSLQRGGEREGQKVVASFLVSRAKGYMGGMSRPIEGQISSSRISPYLAYGCISLKQVVQMTWIRIQDLKNKGDAKFLRSLRAFASRLHWHSHFIQKLESEPRFEYENAFKIYDTIRLDYSEAIISAIEESRTGIPFIDGIIRQLKKTGWINFRARATLVSFVCCTCMQPWKGRFAHWLARLFTDYEPGIHYPQLQMQAGTMGINTIRIYNPVKQLHDKDTDGKFIETWLPELAHLPKHLQAEPWKISEMESIQYNFVLGRDYPFPLVDVDKANRHAREILYSLKNAIHPVEKKALLEKHGSRKGKNKKPVSKIKTSSPQSQNLTLFE